MHKVNSKSIWSFAQGLSETAKAGVMEVSGTPCSPSSAPCSQLAVPAPQPPGPLLHRASALPHTSMSVALRQIQALHMRPWNPGQTTSAAPRLTVFLMTGLRSLFSRVPGRLRSDCALAPAIVNYLESLHVPYSLTALCQQHSSLCLVPLPLSYVFHSYFPSRLSSRVLKAFLISIILHPLPKGRVGSPC